MEHQGIIWDVLERDGRASVTTLARVLEHHGCLPSRSYQAVLGAVHRLRRRGVYIETLHRRRGQVERTTYVLETPEGGVVRHRTVLA